MPLPTPNDNEDLARFRARFMSSPAAQAEFPDIDQRLAVMHRRWELRVRKAGFEQQPRDEFGRWTSGGGGGLGASIGGDGASEGEVLEFFGQGGGVGAWDFFEDERVERMTERVGQIRGDADELGPEYGLAMDNLTDTEVMALSGYTSTQEYADLNRSLRNPPPGSTEARVKATMNSALDKLPPSPGETFRGAGIENPELKYRVGELVTENGFMSTTERMEVAEAFITPAPGETRVIFQVRGSSGREVTPFSGHPTEREVLFPAGSKFRVVSVGRRDGTNALFVDLEEVA